MVAELSHVVWARSARASCHPYRAGEAPSCAAQPGAREAGKWHGGEEEPGAAPRAADPLVGRASSPGLVPAFGRRRGRGQTSLQALHGVHPVRGHSRLRGSAGAQAVGADGRPLRLPALERKVPLSRTRRLIGLRRREPAPGAACSVAGWGGSRRGRLAPRLQQLQVTVLDARMCNNSRFWAGAIAPTMICFQGCRQGSAPTKGDSGGPLVCGRKAAVAGVISFTGRNVTDPFKPPVATSAVKHQKWIRKTLRGGCARPPAWGRQTPPHLHREVPGTAGIRAAWQGRGAQTLSLELGTPQSWLSTPVPGPTPPPPSEHRPPAASTPCTQLPAATA
ncbi:cathepsin G-like isoform X3 [Rhea pennata]|uniref:cathepsin G-like isoform X3 n=1 Tax=Rhea pennata TaxID=8795 RepID=UPI002E277519